MSFNDTEGLSASPKDDSAILIIRPQNTVSDWQATPLSSDEFQAFAEKYTTDITTPIIMDTMICGGNANVISGVQIGSINNVNEFQTIYSCNNDGKYNINNYVAVFTFIGHKKVYSLFGMFLDGDEKNMNEVMNSIKTFKLLAK